MKCMTCKSGEMVSSFSTYMTETKSCIIIIKNVPCLKCKQCGEVVYNTEILENIDGIVATAEKMASEISVVDYSKVA